MVEDTDRMSNTISEEHPLPEGSVPEIAEALKEAITALMPIAQRYNWCGDGEEIVALADLYSALGMLKDPDAYGSPEPEEARKLLGSAAAALAATLMGGWSKLHETSRP